MNEFDGISPIQNSAMEGKPISIRLYNFIIAALIFIGFCVMGAGCYITRDIHFLMYLSSHAFSVMGITFFGTIGGLILMSVAQSRQSVPMSLGGFILFITTFGFISSIGVMAADLPAINTAFTATAAITVIFGALGVLFPRFFAKISGVLCGALLAVVLVEIVLMFMGIDQTATDYVIVALFACFIGWDTYCATQVPPTVPNAVLMASNLFVDIMNVFLRILSIINRSNN